jgi:histidinol dehydrogenase
VVIGEGAARALLDALGAAVATAARGVIVEESLTARGGVLTADSREEAIAFANRYAAEHLLLALSDSEGALAAIRDTGAVFVGEASSVAFGDYIAGGNHVLPTAGHARAASGLSTLDFMRWTAWQRVSPAGAAALADDCARLAEAERLPGHAAAVRAWAQAKS